MKKSIAAAVVCCLVLSSSAFAVGFRTIPPAAARTLLAKDRRVYLLDVRTPDEYRQAHLRGAVLIPLDQIERRFREVPRNRPVLVYCAVGTRSSAAAAFLVQEGYRQVYNMADGIVGWYRNGFALVR